MILCPETEWIIGKILLLEISDNDKKHHIQPVFIVREATRGEYEKWCEETDCNPELENHPEIKYFYLVITD